MRNLLLGTYLNAWSDYAPLILRLAVGVIFFMHGLQKLTVFTYGGVTGMLDGMGFPLPGLMAFLLIAAELVGGAMLVLGLLTRPVAKILAFVSLVALLAVHLKGGFFASEGGYEYILLLLASSVALALLGPGKWALDRLIWK